MIFLRLTSLIALAALPQAPNANIRLTIYDDGLSCPANCDRHVVFNEVMNGTEFAHKPNTDGQSYSKCKVGSICEVCLESGARQCLDIVYRGGGPPPNTFDFTPRFYDSACRSNPSQAELAKKCKELEKAAEVLENRNNCITKPKQAQCESIMDLANSRQSTDRIEYDRCRSMGEKKYNKEKAESQKRSLNCAYEWKATGGPNSKGVTWRRLLPGACRDGTFVGRDGLDCCTGIPLADGPLSRECIQFYPEMKSQ